MKVSITARLASGAFVLALVPAAHALPQWLQPHLRNANADAFAPRDYTIYERAEGIQDRYTPYGYGPQPTYTINPVTTSADPEKTSSSGTQSGQSRMFSFNLANYMLIKNSIYCDLCLGILYQRYILNRYISR